MTHVSFCIFTASRTFRRTALLPKRTTSAHIRAVDAYVGVSPEIWGSDQWQKFEPPLFAKVSEGLPLHRACQAVEPKLKMKPRSALTLVRFFIANRIWRIDWSKRFDALAPLPILQRCPEVTL
jgi:hypothetical protein